MESVELEADDDVNEADRSHLEKETPIHFIGQGSEDVKKTSENEYLENKSEDEVDLEAS